MKDMNRRQSVPESLCWSIHFCKWKWGGMGLQGMQLSEPGGVGLGMHETLDLGLGGGRHWESWWKCHAPTHSFSNIKALYCSFLFLHLQEQSWFTKA